MTRTSLACLACLGVSEGRGAAAGQGATTVNLRTQAIGSASIGHGALASPLAGTGACGVECLALHADGGASARSA